VADSDPFVGNFTGFMEGERLVLQIHATSPGIYEGKISLEDASVFLKAKKDRNELAGDIFEDGFPIPFRLKANSDGSYEYTDETGEDIRFTRMSGSEQAVQGRVFDKPAEKTAAIPPGVWEVYINRIKVEAGTLTTLERAYQVNIQDGRYWYDRVCGAWGLEGGPTVGFIMAGLDLPGPMPADISGGGTGIFINGREIHPMDQRGLHQLFGVTYAGQYWLDAQGNLGVMNGPFIVNIVAAIQQAQSAQQGGSVTHGYGSGSGARGTLSGSGMYSGRTATGKSVFWYPGM